MLQYIMQDINDVIPYLKDSIRIAFGVTCLYLLINLKREKFSWIRTLVLFFFFTYIFVVVNTCLLSREPGSRTTMDLKLFATWGSTIQSHAYVLENVIFFFPLGIFLPILFKVQRKIYIFIATVFLCSLSIETIQKITERGFFQTDDIVTNVLGAAIGYIVWSIFYLIYKKVTKNKNHKLKHKKKGRFAK